MAPGLSQLRSERLPVFNAVAYRSTTTSTRPTTSSTGVTPRTSSSRPTSDRITGLVTNIWHQQSPSVSSISQHVYLLEVTNAAGTCFLIRIRYVTRDYRPLLGARLSLAVASHSLRPLYELPNIPDTIVAITSARIGTSLYLERDKNCDFSILTPFNAVIAPEIFTGVMQKDEEDVMKRQMTFSLFTEWLRLRPKETFVGYVSAILIHIDLVGHWKRKEIFCMPCDCGNVVFGNRTLGECRSCPASASTTTGSQGRTVSLRLNPQILTSLSDETAGFTKGHNLLVADSAWKKLLGRNPEMFEQKLYENGRTGVETERLLRHWEHRLQYLRLTFVVGWTGKWTGGRMVVVDVLS